MRTIARQGTVVALTLLLLAACTQPPNTLTVGASPTPSSAPTPTSVTSPSGGPTSETDPAVPLPAHAFATFPTIKLGSQSDSLPVPGGTVSWSTTDYGVVRFLPEVPRLDIMAATSSKSYAKSYVYAVTVSGKLFVVRVGTDVNSVRITELEPRTGETIGACSLYSGSFAITGDKVYYLAKVQTDLFGKRTSGGELKMARFPCAETATTLLAFHSPSNKGKLISVGDHLLRAVFLEGDKYEIRDINKNTGEVDRVLATVSNEYQRFYAGTDALYWLERSGHGAVKIIRYLLNSTPEPIVTLPYDALYNIGIDEEKGKVFIVFRANSESYFYLYDLRSDALEQLSIDPSLFSSYSNGNGQFLFID